MAIQRLAQRVLARVKALGIGGAIGVGVVCVLLACGGGDEAATAPEGEAPPAAMEQRQAAPPVVDPDVVIMERAQGQLPESFPSDLPVFPEADAADAMVIADVGTIVSFTTEASGSEVYDFYQKELPAQGWSVDRASEKPFSIEASKGGRRATVRVASGAEGGSEILLRIEGS